MLGILGYNIVRAVKEHENKFKAFLTTYMLQVKEMLPACSVFILRGVCGVITVQVFSGTHSLMSVLATCFLTLGLARCWT